MTVEMVAQIGHNRTPFDLVKDAIEDLYGEAKQWLDGEPVTAKDQAEALNTLETKVRDAAKEAEKRRKEEAKPFDDGKAEVQARYKPVQAKADAALDAIKAALKPYLLELDRQQREAARLAKEEADKKMAEALEAVRHRDAANLQSREDTEAKIAAAKAAEEAARKADKAKAHAKGDGRATGIRTVYRAQMDNPREAAAWVWNERNDELMVFVQDMADKAVRAGARSLRGFNVIEEKVL